jgi:hypothetical protein
LANMAYEPPRPFLLNGEPARVDCSITTGGCKIDPRGDVVNVLKG